jgi:ribosomal-protein-alanine N-acetyltransferase
VGVPIPPVIETAHLLLRPLGPDDAADVQRLAGDAAVASTTRNIPHPYPDGAAEAFTAHTREQAKRGLQYTFAMVERASAQLVGCVGLRLDPSDRRAELGYWIGVPHWGRGFATEGARAALGFAFGLLGLNRVFAEALTRNPASARVMQKAGLRYEGTLRQHIVKDGVPEDVVLYGLVRADFRAG